MLRLEIQKINRKWLVEVKIVDKKKFLKVLKQQQTYCYKGIGLNLKDIADGKDTIKWVNDYSLVKRLEEIVERFNQKYGEDNKIDKIVKMLQDGDYDKNVLELLKKLY